MKIKKKIGNYTYDKDHILGKGEYGKVYLAEQSTLKIKLAVKVIERSKIQQNMYIYKALLQEIEILKSVNSENVIKFYDCLESKSNLYIFQELANSGTLDTLLKQKKYMYEEQALFYIVQIIKGFGNLIKNGIIHRDLKPANILLQGNVVKLADFGLSRRSQNMSFMKSIVGSPVYMAPQVMDTKSVYTYKCDIWSFGVVCYQLVTGKIPWQIDSRSSDNQALKQIQRQSRQVIKYPQNIQVSPDFKDMIQGCLQFDEKDRYDWTQIFYHSLFQKKLSQDEKISDNQILIDQAFALTRLRMSVHTQNLDIYKIFSELPDQLDFENFFIALRMMDQDMKNNEAQCIFKSVSHDKNSIQQKVLLEKFEKHGIKLKGMNFSKLNRKNDDVSKNIDIAMQKLGGLFQQKKISDLLTQYEKQYNTLNLKQFSKLLQSMNFNLTLEQITQIFQAINSENSLQVKTDFCIQMLSKLTMTPHIKDQKLKKEIQKLQDIKKDRQNIEKIEEKVQS